jgi:hypothetical protein
VFEDPDYGTVMEKHGIEALYSSVKSLMHAICTEVEVVQYDAVHRMIEIALPWTIRQCSVLLPANGKQLVQTPTGKADLINLELTEEVQAKFKILLERNTSLHASEARRVHRSWLVCVSSVLGDTEGCLDVFDNDTINSQSILGLFPRYSNN